MPNVEEFPLPCRMSLPVWSRSAQGLAEQKKKVGFSSA
jgi:hypothetical protein